MSEDDSSSLAWRAYHIVTPGSYMRPDSGIDLTGRTVFFILVVLLVPFLPFITIVYILSKAFDYPNAQRGPSP